jgi:hypothetical protein
VGQCVGCTGDECVSKADCTQACGSSSIVARAVSTPGLSAFLAALKASSVNETDGGNDDLVDLLGGGLGNQVRKKLAQKLGQLQPFLAEVFPQQFMGQLASSGPTL